MSEAETRALIESAFTAFNAGELEALAARLSENVAFDLPGIGRIIGREIFHWHLGRLSRHFRAQAADIAIMTAPGGVRAATEFTLRGNYLATMEGLPGAEGQGFALSVGVFMDIDDDAGLSRLTICFDPGALRTALQG
ncbi:nuclear transport factor 2 family protein [Chelativorans sp. Marseille-P2723]|uniref:nuclear transport factor 2 family protein n=1 Tax=Chelativorans sp. Marseille-P2723 TaxID=2709133 RepID=UPI00156E5532|nr:nuclear transport factor 2 family protein [Chelativorans sp. Marseille-P2723]